MKYCVGGMVAETMTPMVVLVIAVAAAVIGLALGWALRGPARWCPGCGASLVCRQCGV
jgi:hypothetical protein